MIVSIIGVGLMGSSIAKDLRARGFASTFLGVGRDKGNLQTAIDLGIINEAVSIEEAISKSDVILLGTPVNTMISLLPTILDGITDNTTVIDIGSTKEELCSSIREHKNRAKFVAAHPIAGTENKGAAAAINNLFDNKTCIICESELSSEQALNTSKRLFQCLKMDIIEMSAKDHDLHLAYVSHLSHVISYTLGSTVLELEKDESKILELAGSGFASTARLAKSGPDMWVPIYEQNTSNVIRAVDAYIKQLSQFKTILEEKKFDELREYILNANKIRKVLQK